MYALAPPCGKYPLLQAVVWRCESDESEAEIPRHYVTSEIRTAKRLLARMSWPYIYLTPSWPLETSFVKGKLRDFPLKM
jgi:hypothetical protein